MPQVPVGRMTLDELRQRVEEAEKLLRVARQLARDELSDPAHAEHARGRIASLLRDVQELFPGLGDEVHAADAQEAEESDEGSGEEGEEETEESDAEKEDDGEEWEVDYDKLRAALANDSLMEQVPEADRPLFRAMAERLLESHERGELYARVLAGFEELAQTTRAGAQMVQRQLSAVLTFEHLAAKNKA